MLKPSNSFLTDRSKAVLLLLIFLSLVFRVCLCPSLQPWKRVDVLALLCVTFFLCFCRFPTCCPGSGVVHACIDT